MNDDLISRSAFDEVLDELEGLKAHADFTEGIMVVRRELEQFPSVDAEPVVRCKDCKHFMEFTKTYSRRFKFDGSCGLLAGYTDCDREMRKYTDYCSYGEPRMDAEVSE